MANIAIFGQEFMFFNKKMSIAIKTIDILSKYSLILKSGQKGCCRTKNFRK
jgi:hypothetical protein